MLRYYFNYIEDCEMCGDSSKKHKVLGQRLNTTQGLNPKSKIGISTTIQKCTSCGLIYANPQPIPFDISDHYGIPPESYWRTHVGYFTWSPDYFAHEISVLRKLMHVEQGAKALDVGAGLGKCMISLEKAGFEAYGFEPSKPFYERALSQMQIDSNKLKLGMIEDVDYEKEHFDFITFGAVFEHLYHPKEALQKAMSWLKPGGIVHIEVPSSKYLIQRIINAYYKIIGTNYVSHISPMHTPFHLFEFELNCFNHLSKKLNYEIVHHEQLVGTIAHFPTVTHSFLKKIMKYTNTGMQLIVWLKKR